VFVGRRRGSFEFTGNNIHESIFLQAAVTLIVARILIGFGGGIISFTVISQLHTLVGSCFASRVHVWNSLYLQYSIEVNFPYSGTNVSRRDFTEAFEGKPWSYESGVDFLHSSLSSFNFLLACLPQQWWWVLEIDIGGIFIL
jgi:hypothetical protein